jgi:hypothetical protein
MAKVIEFYVPKNFRKPFMSVAQPQHEKIIEFCATTSGTGSMGRQELFE